MLENFRSQKIIWDRANKTIFEKIEANSGDSNGRKLVVQVINQGVTENLSGTTLSLGWKYRKSAKGLDAFDVVDASKGIFEIYYTTEMLSNIGNIGASLILTDSTSRIESSTFTISVTPSTVDDESVESQNSFTALTEALVKVNEWDGRIDAVEQDYANRANALEETYAPRLTEVTAQLAQTKQEAERKRELEDLSPEVISAIEGGEGTSFDLLSIPQDKSVTYEKLDEKYRYKETPSGIDLNSLTKDGNYYAISPLNSPNNLSGVVNVSNFNAIVMQKFTQHNDPSQVWNRRIFRGTPENWIKEQITEVVNIPRTRLTVDYNAHTSPPTMGSGTNLNTLVSEGYYFIVAGATNIPPSFTGSFFLEVKRVSANFVIQKAYQLSYPERIMIRQVMIQNLEGQYKWVNISQSSQATRNWIALGDSITGTAFRYFYRTRDLLQVNGTNAGVGGSSMASRPDTKYELYEADAFVNKTANLDFSTQNIVTVFFGTNDFGASVPLGAIDSIDPETFNGAMNVGLENIYSSNPKIDLMFITPIWRNGWDVPNEKGLTLKDYVDAIIDFCDRNHIACYDAFRKSGINKFNQSTFLSDGLHPNELGGDKLGSCIASAVKSSI